MEQYTRRNNVRIYGVAEQPEENSDNLAFDFFKSELNVDIASNNISRSHRVSKKSGVEPRPIIVRFTKHNSKVAVMSRRRVLKERKRPFNLPEDLRGGHWGILETAKPKKKIIQNHKTAKKIRPKPKTAYKTVKNRYNGDKWGIQSKLN